MKYFIAITRGLLLLVHTALHMTALAIHAFFYSGERDELGFRYRRLWAKRALRILGIKVEAISINNIADNNVLYVSNHRTLTDPIVQIAYFDSYIIAKSEVGSIPIIGKGAEMTGIIFVDRSKINSRLAARNKTKELLSQGKSVLVYAEGTTTVEKTTGIFKIGTFKAASELGVRVIPIAIEYRDAKDYWSESSLARQMINQVGVWRSYVKMNIGAPIYDEVPKESLKKVQGWIDNQLINMQKGWSKVF